ncbi:MAG: hypothetical protein JNM72_21950 [Deltaproteobacteria bacterium]|nr:hypothetical protein [Deltaproteobacteria bacterium]
MGTLQDWAAAQNIHSMRKLAAEMQGRPGSPWPTDDHRSHTTIATKLAELDRGKDVGWWWGTGAAFRPALAFVLGRELGELEALRPQEEAGHHFGFAGFPTLRPLDLRIEPPFPGVPRELVVPGGPPEHRTWWVAPAGAGKTLVGRWLEQRAGWVYLAGARWRDVANALPATGRVYLELTSAEGHAELLAGYPGLRVCVACAEQPERAEYSARLTGANDARGDRTDGDDKQAEWAQIASPPLAEWLPELVTWARARVEVGGGFAAAGPQAFDAEALEALVHTPGEALELFGVIDEVGLPGDGEWTPRTLQRWVTSWLRHALGRIGASSAPARQLSKEGGELIVKLVAVRLRRGLPEWLTAAEWAALLPATKQELDPAELIRLVQAGGEDLQKRLLDALAATPEAIVELLRQVRALAPLPGAAPEVLALRPRWLAEVAKAKAVEGMYQGIQEDPVRDLGALLLDPETAESALERMIEDIAEGNDSPARRALDADARTPEGAAALDGAVRALGIAAAMGSVVDLSLAERLLAMQGAFFVQRFTERPPMPVLGVTRPDRKFARPLASWSLAVLELSRRLGSTARRVLPREWAPWGDDELPPPLLARLTLCLQEVSIAAYFPEGGWLESDWRRGAFALGAALVDGLPSLPQSHDAWDLRHPEQLARAVRLNLEPPPVLLVELLRLRFGLRMLEEACARNGITLKQALVWCWHRWGAVPEHGECTPLSWAHPNTQQPVGEDDQRALWAAAPATVLGDAICVRIASSAEVFRFLRPELWERILVVLAERLHWWEIDQPALQAAPFDVLLRTFDKMTLHAQSKPVIDALWRRGAPALRTKVAELQAALPDLGDENGPLAMIHWHAPADEHRGLIAGLGAWLNAPGAASRVHRWAWHWLLQRIDGRKPGWREAFALVEQHRDAMARTLAAQG